MATLETVKADVARLQDVVNRAVARLGELADPVSLQALEDSIRSATDILEAKVAETDPPAPLPPPVEPTP